MTISARFYESLFDMLTQDNEVVSKEKSKDFAFLPIHVQ